MWRKWTASTALVTTIFVWQHADAVVYRHDVVSTFFMTLFQGDRNKAASSMEHLRQRYLRFIPDLEFEPVCQDVRAKLQRRCRVFVQRELLRLQQQPWSQAFDFSASEFIGNHGIYLFSRRMEVISHADCRIVVQLTAILEPADIINDEISVQCR